MTDYAGDIDLKEMTRAVVDWGAYRFHVKNIETWSEFAAFESRLEFEGEVRRIERRPDSSINDATDGPPTLEDAIEGLETALWFAEENDRDYVADELEDIHQVLADLRD